MPYVYITVLGIGALGILFAVSEAFRSGLFSFAGGIGKLTKVAGEGAEVLGKSAEQAADLISAGAEGAQDVVTSVANLIERPERKGFVSYMYPNTHLHIESLAQSYEAKKLSDQDWVAIENYNNNYLTNFGMDRPSVDDLPRSFDGVEITPGGLILEDFTSVNTMFLNKAYYQFILLPSVPFSIPAENPYDEWSNRDNWFLPD